MNCILIGMRINGCNYQSPKCHHTEYISILTFCIQSKQLIEIEIRKYLPVPMLIGHWVQSMSPNGHRSKVHGWVKFECRCYNGMHFNTTDVNKWTWAYARHRNCAYSSCYMMSNWQGERLHFVSSAVVRVNLDFAFHFEMLLKQSTDTLNEKGRIGRHNWIFCFTLWLDISWAKRDDFVLRKFV